MEKTQAQIDAQELVKLARRLERLMLRRRRTMGVLDGILTDIRVTRKLIADLSNPTADDLYRPLPADLGPV
jgi:hypothetical protein